MGLRSYGTVVHKMGTHSHMLDRVLLASGVTAGFLFGGWSELLTAFLVMQGLDILTGVLKGGKNREINSRKMHEGVKKKIGQWIGLVMANTVDIVLFDKQPIAITALTFVFIGGEGLSIVENLGVIGVTMPEFMTKYLVQIRDSGNPENEKLLNETED